MPMLPSGSTSTRPVEEGTNEDNTRLPLCELLPLEYIMAVCEKAIYMEAVFYIEKTEVTAASTALEWILIDTCLLACGHSCRSSMGVPPIYGEM